MTLIAWSVVSISILNGSLKLGKQRMGVEVWTSWMNDCMASLDHEKLSLYKSEVNGVAIPTTKNYEPAIVAH